MLQSEHARVVSVDPESSHDRKRASQNSPVTLFYEIRYSSASDPFMSILSGQSGTGTYESLRQERSYVCR